MTITAALVLYAVIWFIVLFVVLQVTLRTQEEAGEVVPGTPPGAPADARIGRKMRLTTLIASGIFAVVAGTIISGVISIRDIDVFGRMGPEPVVQTD
jgi:predicted secreted protein